MMEAFWVVEYTHRHGTDLSAYPNETAAERGKADMCAREAPNECTAEIAAQIQAFFALGHYAEACELYFVHVMDESMEVRKVTVDRGSVHGFAIVEQDNDVVHLAEAFPVGRQSGVTWCGRQFVWVRTDAVIAAPLVNFKAYIPKDAPHVTCLACVGSEGA